MPSSVQDVTYFENLFTGKKSAYGVHNYGTFKEGFKEEGSSSFTLVEPIRTALYKDHLNGKTGLGVVPINEQNKCSFSVIDVDVYDGSISFLIDMLYRYNFPMLPFKSKSGGLHLYTFYESPLSAKKVIDYSQIFIALLGLNKNTEIFPKQYSLKTGQAGNWINLPYHDKGKPRQYLIGKDKEPVLFQEAILIIEKAKTSETNMTTFIENLPLNDAPPCLQSIYLKGETSNRNEYLFSMARYLKTKFGDDFEFKITEINNALDNPVSIKELMATVITTHKKKDYSYRCSQDPILSLCNKKVCESREYGIGGDEVSQLSFEDFIQYTTDPPYYEWIINEHPLIFYSEADIINQGRFRELCLRQLHVLPLKLKDKTWTMIINSAVNNVIIKEVDAIEDMSPGSMFLEYIYEFLEHRSPAENKEQILIDRVYTDKQEGVYVFKPKNLISFLYNQKQFRNFRTTEIQNRLRTLGGGPIRYYISSKYRTMRVWQLPLASFEDAKEGMVKDTIDVDFMEDLEDKDF